MKTAINNLLIVIILIFRVVNCVGQTQEIKDGVPTVLPPSPTVSALMKFEEFPVNNYTGIPDISLPMFTIPTHSKDINLNISLKYHSGVSANDIASDVGLGWSLFAGGTISRTVRGLPDEQLYLDIQNEGKSGIYQSSFPNQVNNFYNFMDNYFNEDENSIFYYPNLSVTEKYMLNDFVWSSAELGRFDTEHDLWQFNFMGNIGKFYIKKNMVTNVLEVVPLDDYRLKIEYNYTSQTINNFIPSSFTIYDEKGYKYIFNIIEKNRTSNAVENYLYGTTVSTYITAPMEHISALHLSQILDNNNMPIVNFLYSNNSNLKECVTDQILKRTTPIDMIDYDYLARNYPCMNEFKPIKSQINSFTITSVRKLTEIEIVDIAKVSFNYLPGRQDTNIALQGTAPYLESISLKTLNGAPIRKYNLEYNYSTVLTKRMILTKLIETVGNIGNQIFEFFYEQNDFTGGNVGKDYWGYLNLTSGCEPDKMIATPKFCTTDLLQKIKYPTGGCAIFDFESNQYSYIGDEQVVNFDENPDNYRITPSTIFTFSNVTNNTNTTVMNNLQPGIRLLTNVNTNLTAKFTTNLKYPADVTFTDKRFILIKRLGTANWTIAADLTCQYSETSDDCCFIINLEAGYQYAIKREILNSNFIGTDDAISVQYYEKNSVEKLYLFGGGNRIKQIGYFDVNVDKNYLRTNQSSTAFAKLKKYNYNFFDNAAKSSGSLVYTKPIYKHFDSFRTKTFCGLLLASLNAHIQYMESSSKNYLTPVKTHGSDVGYKNVEVYETGNGKQQFIYSSPIDFPELISYDINNHVRSKDIDFKRGLILNESTFDKDDKKMVDVETGLQDYIFSEFVEETGVKIFRRPNDLFFQGTYFKSWSNLNYYYVNNLIVTTPGFYATIPMSPISFHSGNLFAQKNFKMVPVKEAYGWAKLKSKATKNYFYASGSAVPNIVTTLESYDYNAVNKKLSDYTKFNSSGEMIKNKYFYHSGNSATRNRIAEIEAIESYKGTEKLSATKIVYANNFAGNNSFLPQNIQSAKGAQSLENKTIYNLYDEFSNILEVQQEGGVTIAYIWGYNKTQPIAKIENATYASIMSQVANLQSLSNTGSEVNLIAALNALRTTLPDAMVTTYTYKPLIGVSTVTDPKGDRINYIYDSFNRLQNVIDKNGNILSENMYNYKLQN